MGPHTRSSADERGSRGRAIFRPRNDLTRAGDDGAIVRDQDRDILLTSEINDLLPLSASAEGAFLNPPTTCSS